MGDIDGERVAQINALLVQAGEAHGRYEETELNGVYDQEWPQWYAVHAIEHGIGDVLGHPVTTEQLATFLERSNRDLERVEVESRKPWATYTAQRIATEL